MERADPQTERAPVGPATPLLGVPANIVSALAAHAEAAYPEECCGLLTGRLEPGRVVVGSVLRCENVAPAADRRRRFEIEPIVVLDALRSLGEGPERLLGFYHSHPEKGAVLSPTDLEFVRLWPETVWLVVPVARGAAGGMRAWWLASGEESVKEMRWV
jgi:proteasome lid subunit RPN8/RPN11